MLQTAIALKVRVSFTNSNCDHDHLKLHFLSYGNQILGISFQLITLQWKESGKTMIWPRLDWQKSLIDQIFSSGADVVNVRFTLSPSDEVTISLGTWWVPWMYWQTFSMDALGILLCKFSIAVPPCADDSWIWGFENQKCAQSTTNVRWPLFSITGTTVGTIVA